MNSREGEKIYDIERVLGVCEHFTNSLNAFTPALSTLEWVLARFLSGASGVRISPALDL